MTDLAFTSTANLARMLRAGKIGSLELLDHFTARQQRYNTDLNVLATADLDAARDRARAADDERAHDQDHGPLHGLPVTIKDAFETAGLTTTGGAPVYAAHIPERDADPVARLREAGAIIMAKTNVPTLSGDWQTYNPLFGRTNNPWDLHRSPGGSSGGPAAAIAAGLTGGDIGSDIGGSIRLPAHFCGLYGHKPSYGLVPMRGHVPPAPGSLHPSALAVTGPLGRSAEDLELLLPIMAAPASGSRAGEVVLAKSRIGTLADLRVAVWIDDPLCPVSTEVSKAVAETAGTLARLGAQVDFDARPDVDFADMLEQHLVLMTAVISGDFPEKARNWLTKLAAGLAPEDRSYLAHQARGAALSYSQFLGLSERMARTRARWAEFFTRFDVLLCPAAPVPAIAHDIDRGVADRRISVDGVERPYMDLVVWMSLATPTHLPATMIPAGQSAGGLPIGAQIIGPLHGDRTTIHVARVLEKEHFGFVPPPSFA